MVIKSFYHSIQHRVDKAKRAWFLLENERNYRRNIDLPASRRLKLYAHGFTSPADILYQLNGTADDYLSDRVRHLNTPYINGQWGDLLNNKLAFHHLLSVHPDHRVGVYAVIRDGDAHPIDGTGPAKPAGQYARERLDQDERIVIKPVTGGGGENIRLCQCVDDGYTINGTAYTAAEFELAIDECDAYLICEFIDQADYARDLYPETPNTIRAVTMIDPGSGEPFIAATVHRIGADHSGAVDNWSQGGLSAHLDSATGVLGAAAQRRDETLLWHGAHPDTGVEIAGTQVPRWELIRADVLAVAADISYIPYVAWDLLVTAPGEFRIIEANNNTDVDLLQVHQPLLANERIRHFYLHHGVI